MTALAIPLRRAERGSSGPVTTIACRRSRPVVRRSASSRSPVCSSALHRPALAWELLRLPPSDRGQPPLAPASREPPLSRPLTPRIDSARLASTRRASATPGASVSELSSRGPRPQFPAVTCFVAAFTATSLDHPPPRRGFATAPRLPRPLSAPRPKLSPRPPCDDRDRYSGRELPAERCPRGESRLRQAGGASLVDVCQVHPIREHDPRIVEPRWPAAVNRDAFTPLLTA